MIAAVARPVVGSTVHFRIPGQCQAATVVAMDFEDPLGGEFTVDLAVLVPPDKRVRDRFDKSASNRPGSLRWANNLRHAPPEADEKLTWHYPGTGCLPAVVIEALAARQAGLEQAGD
jgi:hypothetical protein